MTSHAPPRLTGLFSLGCAVAMMAMASMIASCDSARDDSATATAAVNAALARYAKFATAMAHDSVAALFAERGELGGAGQPTIVGPAAIRAHLESFKGYHVLTNDLHADTTLASRDTAYQAGTFRQRVIIPNGDTVVAQGRFSVVWARERGDVWRIKTMGTRPPN